MEAGQGEGEAKFESFIDQPAILDKYKAAAVVADGKELYSTKGLTNNPTSNLSIWQNLLWSVFYIVSFLSYVMHDI